MRETTLSSEWLRAPRSARRGGVCAVPVPEARRASPRGPAQVNSLIHVSLSLKSRMLGQKSARASTRFLAIGGAIASGRSPGTATKEWHSCERDRTLQQRTTETRRTRRLHGLVDRHCGNEKATRQTEMMLL